MSFWNFVRKEGDDKELWLFKRPFEIRQSVPSPSSKVKRSSKSAKHYTCLRSKHSPAEERRLGTNLDKIGLMQEKLVIPREV